jgi:outer membrane receptor for ferrienterochelin and colicins
MKGLTPSTAVLSISLLTAMNLPAEHAGSAETETAAAAVAATGQAPREANELDPLVVTGTRSERRLSEVPVRTELISRQEIEKTNSQTIADAVEWTTGVLVENDCQNCNFQQVRLLGLQGNFTQVLNDGRPSLSSLSSVYGIEQIPTALVERIEIVKGGGSALYGPGAIAGVINIIPRTPSENGGYVNYDWSTFGSGPNHLFGLGVDRVDENATQGVTVFGQYFSRAPYDHNGDGFTEVSEQESWSGGIRAFWEPTENTRLVADFLTIHEERRGGDQLEKPVTEAFIAEWVDSQLYQGGIRWEHDVSDELSYELSLSGNFTHRDTYYGSGMDPNAFGESESPVYQVDLLTHYQIHDTVELAFGM